MDCVGNYSSNGENISEVIIKNWDGSLRLNQMTMPMARYLLLKPWTPRSEEKYFKKGLKKEL